MVPTLVLAIYPLTDSGLYTDIKRGIIVLLLLGGQSRASNALIDDGSHAFYLLIFPEEGTRKLKKHQHAYPRTITFFTFSRFVEGRYFRCFRNDAINVLSYNEKD